MRGLSGFLFAAAVCLSAASGVIHAQTYTPKAIRFEGSPGLNPTELLRLSGLHEGAPLSKAEIESGLQKLADTGAFTDLSYTVDDTALVVKLTSAGGDQVMAVRFANLPWWTPDELLKLLEARVPLFHGQLPLRGGLTDQVEAAVVALLQDRGIPNGQVTIMQSTSSSGGSVDTIALSLVSPQVVIGTTKFTGAAPSLATKFDEFSTTLSGQDFDTAETAKAIQQTSSEIFEDAGYLDAHIDQPVYAAPRKDRDRYVVDEQVALHPGDLYRIGNINLTPAAPLADGDLRGALTLKPGDPASASGLRVAQLRLAQPYVNRGYLLARADANVKKDPASHTAGYLISFTPGQQFHFASLDATALPSELRADFAKSWHPQPGALVDEAFRQNLQQAITGLHSRERVLVNERLQASDRTVTIVLRLQNSSAPRS